MTGYDIIGDIHGCASALEALLAREPEDQRGMIGSTIWDALSRS